MGINPRGRGEGKAHRMPSNRANRALAAFVLKERGNLCRS